MSLEKTIFEGEVHSLMAKSTAGDLEVLSHHSNLVTPIKKGIVKLLDSNKELKEITLRGGILEVTREGSTLFEG